MVSKLIVAGMLFGAVFANKMELKSEDFELAICKESYKEHDQKSKELKLDELIKTHGCGEKHSSLCLIHVKDSEEKYLTCSSEKMDELHKAEGFTLKGDGKFTTHKDEIKIADVKEIECKPATHKYKPEYRAALLAMHGKKDTLKDLGEVKNDHSVCIYIVEEEPKKEGDKKDDKDKKEIKKISKVYWFTVDKKEYKPTEKVEELTILEKKYKGLHCGKTEDLEKEAKTFAVEDASGCCSCAWYVWVIIAVVIVGAGVGAYFVLKEDKDEDEFEAEYGTTA